MRGQITTELTAPRRWASRWRSQRLAILLLFVSGSIGVLCAFHARVPLMKSPYQLDAVEGDNLYSSSLALQGRPLYTNPDRIPSVFSPYGPVSYYLMSLALRISGVQYEGLRVLVLGFALATAALIAIYLADYSGSWLLGVSFGMVWLSNLHVSSWFYLARVDLIGIGFSVGGLVLFGLRSKKWYYSVPFFVAAWFTKITLIAAPVACLIDLLYQRRYRAAAYYAVSGTALGLCALWAVERYLGGAYLFEMFFGHRTPYELTRFLHFVGSAALHALPFVVLSVIYALVCLRTRRFSLALAYLLICSFTVFSSTSAGADTNHALEWITAAYLCAGEAYASLFAGNRFALGRLLFAVIVAAILIAEARTVGFHEARMESDLQIGPGCSQAYSYVREHGRNILSADPGAVAIAGKQALVLDLNSYRFHGLSDEVLEDLLRHRRADIIALRAPVEEIMSAPRFAQLWSRGALDLIQQNYELSATFDCVYLSAMYEPRRQVPAEATH